MMINKTLAFFELNSDWDINNPKSNPLRSIARIAGDGNTVFVTKMHVINIMNAGLFNFSEIRFTSYGLELFAGLHIVLKLDNRGNIDIEKTRQEPKWHIIGGLTFF